MRKGVLGTPWAALVLACGLSSCIGLQLGQSGDTDAGAAGTGGSAGAATADVDAATGAGCGTDGTSGVTLCRAISACPTVVVDPDLFPNCGFRIHEAALDLECLCGEDLCPMGTAVTCDQVAMLLASQSELSACTQVSEGRCAQTGAASAPAQSPPAATGGQAGAGSGCDRTCQSQCAGDPGCYRICGC